MCVLGGRGGRRLGGSGARAKSSANVALAWLLHNPVVTAPIVGPRTLEQLNNSLEAMQIVLADEQMVRLNEIWPGPGGEAPEAYAW